MVLDQGLQLIVVIRLHVIIVEQGCHSNLTIIVTGS